MSGTINTGGGNVIINMRVTGQQQATTAFAQMQQSLASLRTSASSFELEMRNIDRTLRYMAAGAVVALTTSLVTLAGELERQTVLLQALEGTTAKANERMDQMVALARTVPFSLSAITDTFVKMKTAGIDPIIDAQGNGPMKALLDAVSAFGGTEQQLQRASVAIQQMAGKGVVSMEELRQQLGEAIPTAIKAMAAGMGISIAALIEKVSKGQVSFQTGVTAMLAEFERAYKGAGELLNSTFFGSIRQLKTELDTLALSFNRGGGLDIFTIAVQALQRAFRDLNEYLTSGTITAALDSLANWFMTNSNYVAGFLNTFGQFGSVLATVASAIGGFIASLPPEAAAGGIIGFVIFGRLGMVLGAVAGLVAEELISIVSMISGFGTAVIQAMGSVGATVAEIGTYGLIGFLLFGRTGMLIGALVAMVDSIIGLLRSGLANMVADAVQKWAWLKSQITLSFSNPLSPLENLATSKQAAIDAREAFIRDNASAPGQAFGNIKTTPFGEFMIASKEASREGAAGVESFIQKLQQLRAAVAANRAEYDRRFGNPDAAGGPTQQDIRSLEDFNKAIERAQDRLVGSRGNAIEGWARSQRRVADEFQQTIDRMDMARLQALDAGRPGDADALSANIAKSKQQLTEFRQTIDAVVASETGKVVAIGNRGLERFQSNIREIKEQVEAFQASFDQGRKSEAAEVEKVEAQFARIQKRIESMRISAEASKGADGLQAETLQQLTVLQEGLNKARERGIEIARRKAMWEQQDAQRQATRSVEDARSRLSREQLGQLPGGEVQAGILQRSDALRSSIRSLDDEIRTLERRVQESPQDNWANQWLTQLRQIKQGFQELYQQVGTFAEREKARSKSLFDDIGNALESSFSRGLETLMSGTGKMKDVITGFFNDLNRAVSKYLTNMLFQEMGAAGGNTGTGGLLMKGFNLIGGAITGAGTGTVDAPASWAGNADFGDMSNAVGRSAKGNLFNNGEMQKFARGGAFTNRIVGGPTMFNIGQMGEAGPEAIMPLTRVGGKLGVAAQGGGGSNYNINITALDSTSVRELFYREGSALVGSMQQRTRLNRGMR